MVRTDQCNYDIGISSQRHSGIMTCSYGMYFHLVDWGIARKKLTHPDLFSVREVNAMFKLNER